MKIWLSSILKWAVGKKTYLVSLLVILTTLFLVLVGRLTPETALVVALFALGLFGATFRSALAEHQAQAIAVLLDVARLGIAIRGKDTKAILAAGTSAVQGAAALDQQLQDQSLVALQPGYTTTATEMKP